MDIWEKYRNQTDQTICIIGVIILGVKLCEADGHFSNHERDEILRTIPHHKNKEKALLEIINDAENDDNTIDHHAEIIKKFIDKGHKDFLLFIIADLVKFAKSDHRYSEIEKTTIERVVKIFGLDNKNIIQKSIENIVSKYFNKVSNYG